ncbi:hypothetical protein AB0I84_23420 [Streptomyces spectabilis]|uniref:hypothetical protein n=1 Tax=Streptomyces spectabilis TaxID=68270 RepID=UPI0034009812
MSTDSPFGIPAGPVQTRPSGFRESDQQSAILRNTLLAAGVELGTFERKTVEWLAG